MNLNIRERCQKVFQALARPGQRTIRAIAHKPLVFLKVVFTATSRRWHAAISTQSQSDGKAQWGHSG